MRLKSVSFSYTLSVIPPGMILNKYSLLYNVFLQNHQGGQGSRQVKNIRLLAGKNWTG